MDHLLQFLLANMYKNIARNRHKGTYADHLRADFRNGLVLSDGDVGEQRAVADDRRVRVALDVGPPLPARSVWVTRAEELGLQALELLLVSKLVGLDGVSGEVIGANVSSCLPWLRWTKRRASVKEPGAVESISVAD